MAWTSPTSRSYNDLITDTIWNTDLVDNLVYLKSKADRRIMVMAVIPSISALSTGDGKNKVSIPADLNGANLVDVDAVVYTVSSSGTPTFQVHNVTDSQDMLSTLVTIDANEFTSYTAATPPVINGSYDDVATGDRLRFDCDVAGTGTVGWDMHMAFLLS